MFFLSFLFISFVLCLDPVDRVVAVVEKHPITKSSVLQAAQMFLLQQGKQSFSSQEELDFLLKESLETLINQRVLFEKAKLDTEIVVTNEEVLEYIENHITDLISQQGSKENLEKALGQSISSFKKESWEDVYKLIITERFQQKILGNIDVSIKDVKDFYFLNKDSLTTIPSQYSFSLIDIPIVAGEKVKKDAYNFLYNLKDSIKTSSFEKMAKAYSDDPGSSNSGGDLGYIKRGTLVKEYEKVAFTLNEGEISNPILTPFGYHLIFVIDKKGEKIRTKHILKTFFPNEKDRQIALSKIKDNYLNITNNSVLIDSLIINLKKHTNKTGFYNKRYKHEIDDFIIKELNLLNIGEVSYPFEYDGGFMIIKLYNKEEEKHPTLKNSWVLIKNLTYQYKIKQKLNNLINVYKKEIYINYYN